MNKEIIKIACVTDDNYAQHLGVTIISLLENTNQEIHFYVIDGGISSENKQKLTKIIGKYDCNIDFLGIDKGIFKNFKISHHISEAVYYRILIPELLKNKNIDKVLYLDCDLIVKKDINELWNVNLEENIIGAVQNPGFGRHEELNIPDKKPYFNSGVMLIDIERWNKKDISNKVIEFIKEKKDKILFWDQDGLNGILYNNWFAVKPKWNQQRSFLNTNSNGTIYREGDFLEAMKKPSVIHFTTSSKPWNYMDDHPLKEEYWSFLIKTPWRDYSSPDKNLKNIFIKNLSKIKNYLKSTK